MSYEKVPDVLYVCEPLDVQSELVAPLLSAKTIHSVPLQT